MYVDQLVSKHLVNTMPENTLWATKDHADLSGGDTIRPNLKSAKNTIDHIVLLGIDFDDVTDQLEDEGVEKFEVSWEDLINTVQDAMNS